MLLSLTINKLEQSKDNSNHILYFTNTSILRVNRQYNNNNTESMNFVIMKFNKSFPFLLDEPPKAQNSSLAFKLYFFLSMKTCLSGSGCECTGKANTPNPTRYPKIVCNKNAFQ